MTEGRSDEIEEYDDDDMDFIYDEEEIGEEPDNDEETTDGDVSEGEEASDHPDTEETALEPSVIDDEEKEVCEDAEPEKPVSVAETDAIPAKLSDKARNRFKGGAERFKRKKKPETEDDPDSFRERIRRNRMLRQGYVILRTLSRDADTGEFIRESTLVKREDLPQGAVQCTNEKGYYCLDTIKTSEWYQATRDELDFDAYASQFTASDAALYMVSNKIDNALITKWTDFSHIDMKKVMLPVAAVVCILVFFVIRGF